MRECTYWERAELDVAEERVSRAIAMRNRAQYYVEQEQRTLLALCEKYDVPTQVRSDGSVRLPEGFPAVTRA